MGTSRSTSILIKLILILFSQCLTSLVFAEYDIVETSVTNKGSWHKQLIFYPKAKQITEPRPIVIISHGNGHVYTYYTYLQKFLAGHGFITMSHTNETGPGIETAATTTLENTDIFLEELETLDNGALIGKYDPTRIAWIGHSRGAEGVVRAYTRLLDKDFVPENYSSDNILFISSIAPTTFLSAEQVNPEDVNYHMFVGGADGDVSGAPRPIYMSMPIYERAWGNRQLTYVQGAGHNVFNDNSYDEGNGPNRLARETVHEVSKNYYKALLEVYLNNDQNFLPYFDQHNLVLRPDNIPKNVIISNEYRLHRKSKNLMVIDDFQTANSPKVASHGAKVSFDVENIIEDVLQDGDQSFNFNNDLMNGLTRYIDQKEAPKGIVFEWENQAAQINYNFPKALSLKKQKSLTFRVAQISRHPLTVALKDDLTFSVSITDKAGASALLSIEDFGVATLPYQRDGGWASEFNTIRMPIKAFKLANKKLNLEQVMNLKFLFGEKNGSPMGRIAIDDIEFTL